MVRPALASPVVELRLSRYVFVERTICCLLVCDTLLRQKLHAPASPPPTPPRPAVTLRKNKGQTLFCACVCCTGRGRESRRAIERTEQRYLLRDSWTASRLLLPKRTRHCSRDTKNPALDDDAVEQAHFFFHQAPQAPTHQAHRIRKHAKIWGRVGVGDSSSRGRGLVFFLA